MLERGNDMKKLAILVLTIGLVAIILTFIPFVLDFPYSNSENSGPANYGELIIVMAYERKFLLPGVIALLVGLLLFYKHRKYEETL